jgi:hypothetical protein
LAEGNLDFQSYLSINLNLRYSSLWKLGGILKVLELWSDSFHEGDWACSHLAEIHRNLGLQVEHSYDKGFQPIYEFKFKNEILKIVVYGSYTSWSPIPELIKELISWGKPDFVAYDPKNKDILFAVEETAAIPTGNQALQRCERQYGSSRAKIPFWYLLAEYGTHKDGGVRRDSIWPTIMGVKLSLKNATPSVVLHYADKENPEGYDFGKGVKALFDALYLMLSNYAEGKSTLNDIGEILKEHYKDMFRFLKSQYQGIIEHLPGIEYFDDPELVNKIVSIATKQERSSYPNFQKDYSNFLHWPSSQEWFKQGGEKIESSTLIKHDDFSSELEKSISLGKSYVISSNTGSRPQKLAEVKEWITRQNTSFKEAAKHLKREAFLNMKIDDFPRSDAGNLHLTTAKNILYLFDKFLDVKVLIENSFPRVAGELDEYDNNQKVMVYISNSLKPGRIFGDPFTGQISAYATAFGKFDPEPRLVIPYFPHQSFSQFIDTKNKLVSNKGFVLMRELVDFALLGGGVIVKFTKDGRAEAI